VRLKLVCEVHSGPPSNPVGRLILLAWAIIVIVLFLAQPSSVETILLAGLRLFGGGG
jgi:hypothetical protein